MWVGRFVLASGLFLAAVPAAVAGPVQVQYHVEVRAATGLWYDLTTPPEFRGEASLDSRGRIVKLYDYKMNERPRLTAPASSFDDKLVARVRLTEPTSGDSALLTSFEGRSEDWFLRPQSGVWKLGHSRRVSGAFLGDRFTHPPSRLDAELELGGRTIDVSASGGELILSAIDTPEPGTLGLLGLAGLAAVGLRRRQAAAGR